MSYAEEFFITIRSRDSVDYFPDNTAGNFYVRLPHTLKLTGEWTVGVNEIWMSKHWYNLTEGSIFVSVPNKEYEEVMLEQGFYPNNASLVDAMNTAVKKFSYDDHVEFNLSSFNNRLSITLRGNAKVKFNQLLCSLIGIDKDYEITGNWTSSKNLDVTHNDRIAMVFTDFVTSNLFSDEMLNVIKILDTSYGTYGDTIRDSTMTFTSKIVKDTFDVIHVQIRDVSGNLIKFKGGSCMIQLHFKRQS